MAGAVMNIEVLGRGGTKCKSLAKNFEKAVAEAEAEIVKVEAIGIAADQVERFRHGHRWPSGSSPASPQIL